MKAYYPVLYTKNANMDPEKIAERQRKRALKREEKRQNRGVEENAEEEEESDDEEGMELLLIDKDSLKIEEELAVCIFNGTEIDTRVDPMWADEDSSSNAGGD